MEMDRLCVKKFQMSYAMFNADRVSSLTSCSSLSRIVAAGMFDSGLMDVWNSGM